MSRNIGMLLVAVMLVFAGGQTSATAAQCAAANLSRPDVGMPQNPGAGSCQKGVKFAFTRPGNVPVCYVCKSGDQLMSVTDGEGFNYAVCVRCGPGCQPVVEKMPGARFQTYPVCR